MTEGCVFCPANWPNLDILTTFGDDDEIAVLNPLDPVTPGHVLVIHKTHTDNAGADIEIALQLMTVAASWVGKLTARGTDANIITSAGPLATQTVMHTHVHIVPRRENDGLPLPWTPQHELKVAEFERAHRDWSRDHEGPMPPTWMVGRS